MSLSRTRTLTETVLERVHDERARQLRKHGPQSHLPDGTGPGLSAAEGVLSVFGDGAWKLTNRELAEAAKARCKAASENEGGDGTITFEHILTEEVLEAYSEEDPERLFAELIQVAAVAVQWCEKLWEEGAGRR